MADQAIHCRLMDDDACACRRRSRASLHRLSFSMTCISWPVRLCSAADYSSAAATGPGRGAVKCVDKEKGRSNGSFLLRPLSSLERFCVRQGGRARAHRASGSHSRSAPRARRRSFSQGKAVAAPTMACCCHIASLRQLWLLCVPAARPQIVSVFVNAASSSRLDFARSDRIPPWCSTVSVGSDVCVR